MTDHTHRSQESMEKANRIMEKVFFWTSIVALMIVGTWLFRGIFG